MDRQKVAILGAGSWGTALAQVLCDNGHEAAIWGIIPEQVNEINTNHTNHTYLPDLKLSPEIKAYHTLEEAIQGADAVLFAVPTKAMRSVAKQYAGIAQKPVYIIHASKGLEEGTKLRISQILEQEIPPKLRKAIVVLSGPSHAEEVAARDITTITSSSVDEEAAIYVRKLFMNEYFRIYTNKDIIGVETAGALKNIIALGAGVLYGLGFGDNAKAAIITRGLAEITRLGVAMGAQPLTYMGLSGVGDLIVTGTSRHSRNWRAGMQLGQGKKLPDIEKEMGMIIEGVYTVKAAYELAKDYGVEMPITEAIYNVLYQQKDIKEAIRDIMLRDARAENEYNR